MNDNEFPLTWYDYSELSISKLEMLEIAKMILEQFDETRGDKDKILEDNFSRLHKSLLELNRVNIGHHNIKGAWETDSVGFSLPVAIHPTNIHPRMSVQKSCFTVHGKKKIGLDKLVDERILKKYVIPQDKINEFRSDVRLFGISETTVFPDLDGLAVELADKF
jgi:hypothetical protein